MEKVAWKISLLLFYLDRYTGILYSKGSHKLCIQYLQLRIPTKINMDAQWHTKGGKRWKGTKEKIKAEKTKTKTKTKTKVKANEKEKK